MDNPQSIGRLRSAEWAALIGVALGTFSHYSSALPGAWRWVGNFGALWVAVAFFVARAIGRVRVGAIAGALALVAASVVHYVPFRMAREGVHLAAFRRPVVLWVVVGVAVGALFGALGGAKGKPADRYCKIGIALLTASFAGEAWVLWRTGHPRALHVAVPLELLIALLCPLALLKSGKDRATVYVGAATLTPVVILALSAFMGVIQRVYPGI